MESAVTLQWHHYLAVGSTMKYAQGLLSSTWHHYLGMGSTMKYAQGPVYV